MADKASKPKKNNLSSAADFRRDSNAPLTLPSGKVVRCRKSDLPTLMELGFIPNDLMAVASSSLARGNASPDLANVGQDPESMRDMFTMMDKVVIYAMVEPRVFPAPKWTAEDDDGYYHTTSDDDRFGKVVEADERSENDERLYVDDLDTTDKTFIYGYVASGNRDLESFRKQFNPSMGLVPAGQNLGLPAK